MSEPPAKVARIMPEVNEKFVANGEHLAGLNGECETVKTNKHAESNGMVNGDEKKENGHSRHETNGHANTNLEKECTGDSEKYGDGSELLVKRLSEDAKMPHRGSLHAAGMDLYSAEEKTVPAKGKELVPTKLAITVPVGSYGRIAPRSGLAWKHFIDVGAGVIDHDYTGEVGVLLFNFSNQDYQVKKHERIAQLVIEKIFTPKIRAVEELPKTTRGATGYGASGKH